MLARMSLPIHRFEPQARTVLLESRRLAERRKDAWITPHHLLWVLLSHSASPPANLTPALTAQSLESEVDHTPAPERQLKFACGDPSLKQLLLNLIKASQAQATPAGVPELWDALSEAGILEDYQVAPPSSCNPLHLPMAALGFFRKRNPLWRRHDPDRKTDRVDQRQADHGR